MNVAGVKSLHTYIHTYVHTEVVCLLELVVHEEHFMHVGPQQTAHNGSIGEEWVVSIHTYIHTYIRTYTHASL